MCTLSLFRTDDGYQIFMNRDERHDRPSEHPPKVLCDTHRVFGPVDPVSGGTWVAYNERGFWGCLLNGYFEEEGHDYSGYQSRGGILLEVLSQDDPLAYAAQIDTAGYPSFRLVIGSAAAHKLFVWNGKVYGERAFHARYNDEAYFLSSSSWEQADVIQRRKALFEAWLRENGVPDGGIPSFHYSRAPSPESAPMMHRSYSRTQSITAMDVSESGIEMTYERLENPAFSLAEAAE